MYYANSHELNHNIFQESFFNSNRMNLMQHEFHDLRYNHLALMNAGIDEIPYQYSCWHEWVAVFLYECADALHCEWHVYMSGKLYSANNDHTSEMGTASNKLEVIRYNITQCLSLWW